MINKISQRVFITVKKKVIMKKLFYNEVHIFYNEFRKFDPDVKIELELSP